MSSLDNHEIRLVVSLQYKKYCTIPPWKFSYPIKADLDCNIYWNASYVIVEYRDSFYAWCGKRNPPLQLVALNIRYRHYLFSHIFYHLSSPCFHRIKCHLLIYVRCQLTLHHSQKFGLFSHSFSKSRIHLRHLFNKFWSTIE